MTTEDRVSRLDDRRRRLLERRIRERSRAVARDTAIRPRPRDGSPVPASFAQERLWVIDQLAPGRATYNVPVVVRLRGPLDPGALESALAEVTRRHEVLRTSFRGLEAGPVQVVADDVRVPFARVDLRHLPEPERAARAVELARTEVRRPFDLSVPPMLRAALFALGDRDHLLALSIHHIASDGWSTGILLREVAELYGAASDGRPAALAAPDLQYADHALWQRERLSGAWLERELAHWTERLGPDPRPTELPADRPRPAVVSNAGSAFSEWFPAELRDRLLDFCRRHDVTVFMALAASFMAALHRCIQQERVLIGTTVANRGQREAESMVGFFVNTLPLAADCSGDPTFAAFLDQVRDTTLDVHEHQEVPFDRLVEALRVRRDPGRTPLVQVVLALINTEEAAFTLPGLDCEAVELDTGTSRFDLSLVCFERADGIQVYAEHSTDLFEADTIRRLLRAWRTLLEAAIDEPGLRLSELPLLGPAERRQLLVEWNDNAAARPPRTISTWFRELAAERAGALAVRFEGEELSYTELALRADRVARRLRALGVGPERRVAVHLERGLDMVIAVLGALHAGAAYVPLDPAHPAQRLRHQLDDVRPPVVLTAAALAVALPDGPWLAQRMEELAASPDGDAGVRLDEGQQAGPANLAYVLHTSGSTGRPKGVMIDHAAACDYLAAAIDLFRVTPADRMLQFAALTFDVSVFEIFTALLAGASLHLGRREELLSPIGLADFLRRERITIADLPPALMGMVDEPATAFPDLRALYVGGEPYSAELVNRWTPAGRRFVNGYGPTEATVSVTVKECVPPLTRPPTIGRPLPNTGIYVLDAWRQPLPVGVPGELCCGGIGLARGYQNLPDMTAAGFFPSPFGPSGSRLYATGDLVRFLPDGDIEFIGRIDTQVKVAGVRIEVREIESLLAAHPAVRQVAVTAPETPEGGRRLVAYVALDPAREIGVGDLRAYLAGELPTMMVPSQFVRLDELPVTTSGKVDRRRLPSPEGRDDGRPEHVAPRSETERLIANSIFTSILGVDRVGAHDNFFDLGGNSLQAVQLVYKVRQAFRVDVPLRTLLGTPTVAALADAIGRQAETAEELIALLARVDTMPDDEVDRLLARYLDESAGSGPPDDAPPMVFEGGLDWVAEAGMPSEMEGAMLREMDG